MREWAYNVTGYLTPEPITKTLCKRSDILIKRCTGKAVLSGIPGICFLPGSFNVHF